MFYHFRHLLNIDQLYYNKAFFSSFVISHLNLLTQYFENSGKQWIMLFSQSLCLFQLIIISVWVFCILYSSPKFFWAETVTVPREENNTTETLCVLNRKKYDSKASDIVHFVLFYVFPLLVMLVSWIFLRFSFYSICNASESNAFMWP